MKLDFMMPSSSRLEEDWDVIVVGGGPGGLTSAIYLARYGLKTLVVEKELPGGKVNVSPLIENYPGFPSISGGELAKKFYEHAEKAGAQILFPEEVTDLILGDEKIVLTSSGKKFRCKALILATGSEERRLNVPGERELLGRGVSYCAVCDGPLYRGKRVAVIGGGHTAAVSVLYLSQLAEQVFLIHRRDRMRAERSVVERMADLPNVELVWNSVVEEIRGTNRVERLIVRDLKTGDVREIEVDGIFVAIGVRPNSDLARKSGISVDERGFILTDRLQRTSAKGVYAVGDVTGEPMQISKAVGQGTIAAVDVYERIFGGAYGGPGGEWDVSFR